MKILPINNCGDCPNMTWMDLNYSVNCDLSGGSVRFKEIGSEEALSELFKDCPLDDLDDKVKVQHQRILDLEKRLRDCEKFRYIVFKRMSELNDK